MGAGSTVKRPAHFAQEAAEAVRALNHATFLRSVPGYEWPADIDAVIGGLAATVYGMAQALDQAHDWLSVAHQDARVGHDQHQDATADVDGLLTALARIIHAVNDLAARMNDVRSVTAHLTGITT